jgi:hypothetical protein
VYDPNADDPPKARSRISQNGVRREESVIALHASCARDWINVRVIRQEDPFNAAAAEFARVVKDSWRDKPAVPLFFNGVYPKMFAPTHRANVEPRRSRNKRMEREAGVNTVVLIHGLSMTPLSWEHWVTRYQRQGPRVIAPGYRELSRARPGSSADIESTRAHSTQARQGIGRGGLLCIQEYCQITASSSGIGSPRLPH